MRRVPFIEDPPSWRIMTNYSPFVAKLSIGTDPVAWFGHPHEIRRVIFIRYEHATWGMVVKHWLFGVHFLLPSQSPLQELFKAIWFWTFNLRMSPLTSSSFFFFFWGGAKLPPRPVSSEAGVWDISIAFKATCCFFRMAFLECVQTSTQAMCFKLPCDSLKVWQKVKNSLSGSFFLNNYRASTAQARGERMIAPKH